jgi:hypothetical protein
MHIIAASFDADAALSRTSEVLALGDSPERLAEKLGVTRELDVVKEGVAPGSFKRLVADITKLRQYGEVEKQLEEIKNGKSMLSFLGAKFKEKQIAKLEEDLRKFGSLIEAPRWFYRQPRVQILSAIRDYALDGSQQGDAAWIEVEETSLVFPICNMYEHADMPFAQKLISQLEKPLRDVDPKFVLGQFEGNRSITFDFEKGVATYYTPAPSA